LRREGRENKTGDAQAGSDEDYDEEISQSSKKRKRNSEGTEEDTPQQKRRKIPIQISQTSQ